jgi:hypothetical protein
MQYDLLFLVSSFQLVSNRQNQNYTFGGHPTVLGNVTVSPPRQNEFTATIFSRPPKQWVIRQQIESSPNTEHSLASTLGIVGSYEVE